MILIISMALLLLSIIISGFPVINIGNKTIHHHHYYGDEDDDCEEEIQVPVVPFVEKIRSN